MKVPILIPSIFDYPLTYENKKQETLKIGDFVKVPFGSKQVTGVVWNFEQETDKKMKIKKIIKKIDIPKININTNDGSFRKSLPISYAKIKRARIKRFFT